MLWGDARTMQRGSSETLLTLFSLIGSLTPMSSIRPVSAEYRYVNLAYLGTYEDEFLNELIITSGTLRVDYVTFPEQPGNAYLETYDPFTGMFLYIYGSPPNGSTITVYGLVSYLMMGYYIQVSGWEYGTYWNPADINHDLKVNIYDVVMVADAYGATPSDLRWDPFCDVAPPYGLINIYDVTAIADHYGEEYNP